MFIFYIPWLYIQYYFQVGWRMSDNHQLRLQPLSEGDINDVNMLSDDIGKLFRNSEYSDLTLQVENRKFQIHKVVLAARSEYFRYVIPLILNNICLCVCVWGGIIYSILPKSLPCYLWKIYKKNTHTHIQYISHIYTNAYVYDIHDSGLLDLNQLI